MKPLFVFVIASAAVCAGCTSDAIQDADAGADPVYQFANGCFSLRDGEGRWLSSASKGAAFGFAEGDADDAAAFFMKPSDLGTYLLYDGEGQYLFSEDGPLLREDELDSDVLRVDDTYVSGAEWELMPMDEPERYQLRHRKTGEFLASDGLGSSKQAASLALEPAEGCQEHPELTLDAKGDVEQTTFDDGTLYGIVDTHSHILSNFGFGGGGIFHGAPFHRLGVEHALSDCATYHGEGGRKDFFGFGFGGTGDLDAASLLPLLLAGELSEDDHETTGYPEFTDWPNAPSSSTHQTQYYRWLERAHLAGLRLVVQHATTNSIICEMIVGEGFQPVRYSCNDMVAVDRIIEETYAMERYIDAQAGGPGLGFFRIVDSPERAREVIEDGKMAVVLGIETSNLFDCFLEARPGMPQCDLAYVRKQLDTYHERGVRVLFPSHKYDNAFSAGDGHGGFIELGNLINSGHWSNFTEECPADVENGGFDGGEVTFGGLNQPREVFMSRAPNDMSGFAESPIGTLTPFLLQLTQPALEGDYCQNAGLTPLGESLLQEIMQRGMVLEVDHLPQHSYKRAFELLKKNDYPAVGTHGRNHGGRLYALGGVSKTGIGRCRDPKRRGATLDDLTARVELAADNGAYPAEGFGFDLNGFAGAHGPRFGDDVCPTPQDDPVTYPFKSFAGDVTFTKPSIGNRKLDYNTEGLVHIGMLPELLDDARRDAKSDKDLEPLYRSAEGYIRMWERSEKRGAALSK